jgi:hypothetical protein
MSFNERGFPGNEKKCRSHKKKSDKSTNILSGWSVVGVLSSTYWLLYGHGILGFDSRQGYETYLLQTVQICSWTQPVFYSRVTQWTLFPG